MMRVFLAVAIPTPVFAGEDVTSMYGIWDIVVIVVAFVILAFIGSRQ